MTVALVTAGGVVLVAIISVLGSFLQSFEQGARLKRDAEILGLLAGGTAAHDEMQRWVNRAAREFHVRQRRRSNSTLPNKLIALGLIIFAVGCALGLQVEYLIPGDTFTTASAYVYLAVGLVAVAAGFYGNLRVFRQYVDELRSGATPSDVTTVSQVSEDRDGA